jgi:pyrroline-5-carboxylate reductase
MTTHLAVGAGRMGGALISGWTSGRWPAVKPRELCILDPHPSAVAQEIINIGARHITRPAAELSKTQYCLLAIKPQMLDELGADIAAYLPDGCVVISILAGSPLDKLSAIFSKQVIVRAMPNTPASIGAGITAFTCGAGITKAQKKQTRRLLSAGGAVHEVENEHLIDVVTAVSGSGPAYIFHMVEALEAAAIKAGMPDAIAPDFARQTIIGAGALLASSEMSAGELRRAVTSPNGTTQAALDVLMGEQGLPPLMRETVGAALRRAKELAQGD